MLYPFVVELFSPGDCESLVKEPTPVDFSCTFFLAVPSPQNFISSASVSVGAKAVWTK